MLHTELARIGEFVTLLALQFLYQALEVLYMRETQQ